MELLTELHHPNNLFLGLGSGRKMAKIPLILSFCLLEAFLGAESTGGFILKPRKSFAPGGGGYWHTQRVRLSVHSGTTCAVSWETRDQWNCSILEFLYLKLCFLFSVSFFVFFSPAFMLIFTQKVSQGLILRMGFLLKSYSFQSSIQPFRAHAPTHKRESRERVTGGVTSTASACHHFFLEYSTDIHRTVIGLALWEMFKAKPSMHLTKTVRYSQNCRHDRVVDGCG